jgi:copper chaperone CopZ
MLRSFEIDNVRCGGCVNTITKTLENDGFSEVTVDLSCEPRKITLEISDEAQVAHLRSILKRLGYPFSDEEVGYATSTVLKAKSIVSCAVGKFSEAKN